jgi:hypothetical protein
VFGCFWLGLLAKYGNVKLKNFFINENGKSLALFQKKLSEI